MPGRRGLGVLEEQFGDVADPPAGVGGPPGQVGLLVREEELGGPVTGLGQHLHAQGVSAAEEARHVTAAHRIGLAHPGHVPLLGLAVLVGDAEADDAQARVGRVQLTHPAQHVDVHEQPVVVQFHHDVDIAVLAQPGEGHVPPARASEVLLDVDGGDPAGQGQPGGELGQPAAVADDHDAGGFDVLLGHGLQQGVDFGGPVAHGHHGDRDPRLHHVPHPIRQTAAPRPDRAVLAVHQDVASRVPVHWSPVHLTAPLLWFCPCVCLPFPAHCARPRNPADAPGHRVRAHRTGQPRSAGTAGRRAPAGGHEADEGHPATRRARAALPCTSPRIPAAAGHPPG